MIAATDRLGQFLTERTRYVDPETYAAVRRVAQESGTPVLNILIQRNAISAHQAHEAYAHERGWILHRIPLDFEIPEDIVGIIPAEKVRELQVVPVGRRDGRSILVATPNPDDGNQAKVLQGITGEPILPVYAPREDISAIINRYYSTSVEATAMGQRAVEDLGLKGSTQVSVDPSDDEAIPRMLKVIIDGALDAGADDIHLDPGRDFLSVRFSIDGKQHNEPSQPRDLGDAIARLIKVRARLDASSLHAQSGSLDHQYKNRTVSLRAAVLPTPYGEAITLRPNGGTIRPLSSIGFTPQREKDWRRQIYHPSGLLLAVGPMGSGKSSLNYASIAERMKDNPKIVSMERPIETLFPSGITQVEINPSQGRDWEDVLPHVLRSGAEILNVGEINEPRIAETVVQAALSGHLVFSTLHTNDAAGAIVRLREMGIRPSVLADTLRGICSQRLPRLLCEHCKVRTVPTRGQIEDFKLTEEQVEGIAWFGPSEFGCRECRQQGYKGRSPIHELMIIDKELHELILEDVPARNITAKARELGMLSLLEDGLAKAKTGVTSLAEIRSHILIH